MRAGDCILEVDLNRA